MTTIASTPITDSHLPSQAQRLQHAVFALFLLVCSAFYTLPIWDSDFWWHIASGRHIVAQGSLPTTDPFAVFGNADPIRNSTVLTGQWFGQVTLFAVFDALGANAIVALRALLLLICLTLIYIRCQLLRVGPIALWSVLLLAGFGAADFSGERPQLLSFLFAAIFFLLLDLALNPRGKRQRWRYLLALPPLTLVWANSHGGFILAVALLISVIITAALTQRTTDTVQAPIMQWHKPWLWLAICLCVVVASLLTPNGLQTYYYLLNLEGSDLQSRTSEYISAWRVFELGQINAQAGIYSYFLLTLLALWGWIKHRAWIPMVVSLLLAAASISAIRYYIFYLLIAAPYVALGLTRSISTHRSHKKSVAIDFTVAAVLCGALIMGAYRGLLFQGGMRTDTYPVAIADFVKTAALRGRAFNGFEWGGYLIWRLSPTVRLYIDGRMLEQARFAPYTHILWATSQGQQWFEREKFDLVILPHHGRYDPQRYGLIDYLANHRDWRLGFHDQQGVVFIRQRAANFFP